MANILSFLILCLLLWGRSLRFKNLPLHIRVMNLTIICDVFLVVGLVVFRDALSKVSLGMPWTLKIHIPIALGTLALYAWTARTGYRLHGGDESARPLLKRLDKVVVTVRILNLVTSLMVQFIPIA